MGKLAVAGFYIAEHPCLDAQTDNKTRRVKVGHSGDLGSRLHNDAYVTNFPEGWRYAYTVETQSKESAYVIEQAVLKICDRSRVRNRELVDQHPDEIIKIAKNIVGIMEIDGIVRVRPEYEKPARPVDDSLTGNVRGAIPTKLERSYIDEKLIDSIVDRMKTLSLCDSGDHDLIDFGSCDPTGGDGSETIKLNEKELNSEDEIGDFDHVDIYEPVVVEDREYHNEACRRCLKELGVDPSATPTASPSERNNSKTILQMACRSGKTRVGYMVSEYFDRVLFIVPSLSLLKQTAAKIENYGRVPDMLVGSDDSMTTDTEHIEKTLRGKEKVSAPQDGICRSPSKTKLFVISTYHSAHLLPDIFDLIIFDEAHRLCGSVDLNEEACGTGDKKKFTVPLAYGGSHLFMTATPRYDANGLSMKNKEIFGSVAYKYHLRQGIKDHIINDFEVKLIPVEAKPDTSSQPDAGGDKDGISARQIETASSEVDKMFVFCKSIAHADRLCELVRNSGVEHLCLRAHSKLPRRVINGTFARFCESKKSILFNCRLFQEGVECRPLDAVFFASPRKSPRDIIQTMCRPLSKYDGKGVSKIFVPVTVPTVSPLSPIDADDEAFVEKFNTANKHLTYFADALRDEDPSLYEYLLGNGEYKVEWVGKYSADVMTKLFRRTVNRKNRLVKRDKLPWPIFMAEMRNSIEKRNRYPKNTEIVDIGNAKINLGQVYKSYAKLYLDTKNKGQDPLRSATSAVKDCSVAGGTVGLQSYQMFDLASLPQWEPFGAEGPYARSFVIPYLKQFLEENKDNLDEIMINVSNGGYIGLNATAMERLSGYLTTMNQQDAAVKNKVKPEKKMELTAICEPYGLKMFHARRSNGRAEPDKTYIQECNRRFQEWVKKLKDKVSSDPLIQRIYPGYPEKHRLMEDLNTARSDYSYSKIQQLSKTRKKKQ